MATEAQRIQAIHDVLIGAAGVPDVIVWENDLAADKGITPRLEYTVGRATPQRITISGDHARLYDLRCVVVVDAGTNITDCIAIGEAIEAAFAVDTKVSDMQVMAAAHMPGGFKDNQEYRFPVQIPLRQWGG